MCGRQLPYLVGFSFPYGIRFPAPNKKGAGYQAAVSVARLAPKYSEAESGDILYHTSLYDLHNIRRLVELLIVVKKMYRSRDELIQHTIDGRRFISGLMPWGCFADRVEQRPARGLIVPHSGVKCFSLWGCHFAQERQPHYLHIDGKEVFRHGLHGFFRCGFSDEELFGRNWPPGLWKRLAETPFQFDKKKIRDGIMRLIKQYGGNHCPAFSAQHLDAALESIPDALTVAENPAWGIEMLPGHWPGVALNCYKPEIILNLSPKTLGGGFPELGNNNP